MPPKDWKFGTWHQLAKAIRWFRSFGLAAESDLSPRCLTLPNLRGQSILRLSRRETSTAAFCPAEQQSRLTCWLPPFSSSHTQTGGGNLFFGCKLYHLMPTYNWQLALTCIGAAKWLWSLSEQLQVLLVKGKPSACFFLATFSLTNSCLLLPGHVWFLFHS